MGNRPEAMEQWFWPYTACMTPSPSGRASLWRINSVLFSESQAGHLRQLLWRCPVSTFHSSAHHISLSISTKWTKERGLSGGIFSPGRWGWLQGQCNKYISCTLFDPETKHHRLHTLPDETPTTKWAIFPMQLPQKNCFILNQAATNTVSKCIINLRKKNP